MRNVALLTWAWSMHVSLLANIKASKEKYVLTGWRVINAT
jgi:hypothetical protein